MPAPLLGGVNLPCRTEPPLLKIKSCVYFANRGPLCKALGGMKSNWLRVAFRGLPYKRHILAHMPKTSTTLAHAATQPMPKSCMQTNGKRSAIASLVEGLHATPT